MVTTLLKLPTAIVKWFGPVNRQDRCNRFDKEPREIDKETEKLNVCCVKISVLVCKVSFLKSAIPRLTDLNGLRSSDIT